MNRQGKAAALRIIKKLSDLGARLEPEEVNTRALQAEITMHASLLADIADPGERKKRKPRKKEQAEP